MATRALRIPIWVRASVIIAAVLIGVVISSLALGASGLTQHEMGSMTGTSRMDHGSGEPPSRPDESNCRPITNGRAERR